MKKQAEALGFEAFSPLDSEVDIHDEKITKTIFDINMQDIDKCDVVVANIAAFRGCCVDDGTSFELGAAFAKGKRIICYTPTAKVPLKARVQKDFEEHGEWLEKDKFPRTEDFPGCKDPGPVNLMITEAVRAGRGAICETYEQCLELLAAEVREGPEQKKRKIETAETSDASAEVGGC